MGGKQRLGHRSGYVVVLGVVTLLARGCGGGDGNAPSSGGGESGPSSFVNAVLQAYVKASNTKPGDLSQFPPTRGIGLFGSSVALSGDTLAVGLRASAAAPRASMATRWISAA